MNEQILLISEQLQLITEQLTLITSILRASYNYLFGIILFNFLILILLGIVTWKLKD